MSVLRSPETGIAFLAAAGTVLLFSAHRADKSVAAKVTVVSYFTGLETPYIAMHLDNQYGIGVWSDVLAAITGIQFLAALAASFSD